MEDHVPDINFNTNNVQDGTISEAKYLVSQHVTRACGRPRNGLCQEEFEARRSEGIVGLSVPHVRPNLDLGDFGVKGLRTVKSPHASENVLRAHVRMTSEVGDRRHVSTRRGGSAALVCRIFKN
ncbi:jg15815 [Pararge aegeria aegeria]|uniref:Jg15815 protein n=1 Tax=Pararge aegeria aegeria TaxID=348720 RepID=A0A8S4SBE0_9NEOP|nr:jg15815 [Pararge aegeria aegeria]